MTPNSKGRMSFVPRQAMCGRWEERRWPPLAPLPPGSGRHPTSNFYNKNQTPAGRTKNSNWILKRGFFVGNIVYSKWFCGFFIKKIMTNSFF
jgi:hypothetical protein